MLNITNLIKLLKLILKTKYEQKAGDFLLEKNRTISVAESCTGGLLSSLLTDVSGSSAYIKANFVTYANEAKTKYLNVSEQTLNEHGAVSVQTAEEMVKGLLKETNSDYAIATTGIAGPTGGSKTKPVGLVYIGIGSKNDIRICKYNVNPNLPRIIIKYKFAKHALKLLNEFFKEEQWSEK